MTPLYGVLEAAGEVQHFCHAKKWAFCFIGGVAVQRWGEPRFTQDVDLTLLTGLGQENAFIDALLAGFAGRRADAKAFAVQHRVLLVRTGSGIDVDVALGGLPFEERTIERASAWDWGGSTSLFTCSAEDLLVHKVFAGRDRDWGDVDGILARQHGRLDLTLVRQELGPLLDLKEEPEALAKFEHRLAVVSRRLSQP